MNDSSSSAKSSGSESDAGSWTISVGPSLARRFSVVPLGLAIEDTRRSGSAMVAKARCVQLKNTQGSTTSSTAAFLVFSCTRGSEMSSHSAKNPRSTGKRVTIVMMHEGVVPTSA